MALELCKMRGMIKETDGRCRVRIECIVASLGWRVPVAH